MKNPLLTFLVLVVPFLLVSQQNVDGSFPFETDPNKKYSLYIPSSYDEQVPNKLMLGLHPFNTARWDGRAWRDTLVHFAEENNLLLVCPDGGLDGQIDSPIDTAFTTALLDSVELWYNVDMNRKYIMGFSWGGKTTYTYGLRRTGEFSGYIAIGAAVNYNEVSSIISNAKDEAFYLIHGSNDALGARYTPLLTGLQQNEACVEGKVLIGVGHTIDFPDRNAILTEAFEWIENSTCNISGTGSLELSTPYKVYPNPVNAYLNIEGDLAAAISASIIDASGTVVKHSSVDNKIVTHDLPDGLYILDIDIGDRGHQVSKLIVKH